MNLSIITINFNNKKGLEKTFNSIFSQINKDFEYIVIDGESSDGSIELIDKYKNSINKILIETDSGIFNAQNKGIAISSGEYLLFLNSGDCLVNKNVIKNIYSESFDSSILYGDIVFEYKNGFRFTRKIPSKINEKFFYIDSIPHPSSIIRKELLESCGFYDENFSISADYDFYLKAIYQKHCTYRHVNYPISVFHLDGASTSKYNQKQISTERKMAFIENIGRDRYNEYQKYHFIIDIFQKKLPYLYNLLVGLIINKYDISRY